MDIFYLHLFVRRLVLRIWEKIEILVVSLSCPHRRVSSLLVLSITLHLHIKSNHGAEPETLNSGN